jgi:hypothetical protein
MKFVYYLAAIGHRGLAVKLNILEKNLNYIHNRLNADFDIVVNCYNSADVIYNFVQTFPFLTNKMFHNKPGVLTELFLTNPYNAALSKYDYILFMLDDVEIQDLNLREMIKIKEKYQIELLSPKVINSTHAFMNSYASDVLTINNALEVYCLLLKFRDFQRFLSIHTVENKWMWGADFLFGYFNIKAGVYNKASVKHMLLPSKKNTNNAEKLMRAYLKQVNFYGSIKDITPVKISINLRTGTTTKPIRFENDDNDSGTGKIMRVKYSSPNVTIQRTQLNDYAVIKLLGKVNKHRKNVIDKSKIDKSKINNKAYRIRKASKTSVNRVNIGVTVYTDTVKDEVKKATKSKTSVNKASKFTLSNFMN